MFLVPEKLRDLITEILANDYFEGAVEVTLAWYPEMTRDQALDLVERVEANHNDF